MKTVKHYARQGDVFFVRLEKLPDDVKEIRPQSGQHVVAHSETGHHHVIDATGIRYYQGSNPLIAYLVMESVDSVSVDHLRSFDQHESLSLLGDEGGGAVWGIGRQIEATPWGSRMVQD